MFTTDPAPLAIMCGMTCLDSRKIALRLTFITRSQDSSGMSTTVPCSSIPAEFRRPVTGPRSEARLATAAHSASCETSATKASIRDEAISSRPRRLMSTATTVAPQSAKCLADSRPRPDAAPVTMTTPESFVIRFEDHAVTGFPSRDCRSGMALASPSPAGRAGSILRWLHCRTLVKD
jgi:hypothetical protein